jgi:hypothetical protein
VTRTATLQEIEYLRYACKLERSERDPLYVVFSIVVPLMLYSFMFVCYAMMEDEVSWNRLFWMGLIAIILSMMLSNFRLKKRIGDRLGNQVELVTLSGQFFDSVKTSYSMDSSGESLNLIYYIGSQRVHVPEHWRGLTVRLGDYKVEADSYIAPWGIAFPVSFKGIADVEKDIADGLLRFQPVGIGSMAAVFILAACVVVGLVVSDVQPARMAGGISHNYFMIMSIAALTVLLPTCIVRGFTNASIGRKLRRGIVIPDKIIEKQRGLGA